MFVLPVLAVLTAGMLACAVIAPVAGVIEFAGGLFGFDVPFCDDAVRELDDAVWLTLRRRSCSARCFSARRTACGARCAGMCAL